MIIYSLYTGKKLQKKTTYDYYYLDLMLYTVQ